MKTKDDFNVLMRSIYSQPLPELFPEPTAEQRRLDYLRRIAYTPSDPSPARLNPVL